jgi:DNA-binding transcriptional regulator YdaS (Cro superfamily)
MDLKKYLWEEKIKPAHMAYEIGVSPATVYHWLRGKSKPNTLHCAAIEKYTNNQVKMRDFYG